uniref:Attractin n=1 Tax=Strongyloides papillosus TaxID=174720 RepID=A0A0N5C9V4_STREA
MSLNIYSKIIKNKNSIASINKRNKESLDGLKNNKIISLIRKDNSNIYFRRTNYFSFIFFLIIISTTNVKCSFQIQKSSNFVTQKQCDKPCFNNGTCVNGSCVCPHGWSGAQCDYCYGRISISDNQKGFIFDGPNNYHSSMKCTWIISNSKNNNNGSTTPLRLHIESFDTECSWDYVYIYDGDGVYGKQIGALSGAISPIDYIASSGSALIYFTSDVAFNMGGFNITYDYDSCSNNCSYHGKCIKSRCSCDKGYRGTYCEIPYCDIDMNGSRGPCLNEGLCKDGKCNCGKKYHGEYCQNEITELVIDKLHYDGYFEGRASHTAVTVDDIIWIYGGTYLSGVLNQDIVMYDVKKNQFSVPKISSKIPDNRYDHSMVLYKNKLYIFGGVLNKKVITNELWSFDIITKEFNLLSPHNDSYSSLPLAVAGHTAHIIGDEMYVFFGYNPYEEFIHQTQIYSFTKGKWRRSEVNPNIEGRYGHSSALLDLPDKKNIVLVYGGYNAPIDDSYSYLISNQLLEYDPTDNSWIELDHTQSPIYKHSSVLLHDTLIIVGGNAHNESSLKRESQCLSKKIFSYDVTCNEWFPLSITLDRENVLNTEMHGHVAVKHNDNMYIIGGFNGQMLSQVLKFTPPSCEKIKDINECTNIKSGIKCIFEKGKCKKRRNDVTYSKNFMDVIKFEGDDRRLDNCIRTELFNKCSLYKNCKYCNNRKDCSWCSSSKKCLKKGENCLNVMKRDIDEEVKCSDVDSLNIRYCGLAKSCYSCKQLPHCSWMMIDTTQTCLTHQEEEIILKKQRQRQIDRLTLSSDFSRSSHAHNSRPLSVSHLISSLPSLTLSQTNQTCPIPCALRTSCSSCLNSQCMWCPMTQRCVDTDTYMISFPYGQCQGWVTAVNFQVCQSDIYDCRVQKSPEECQLSGPHCGWCDNGSGTGLGQCIPGNLSGPQNSSECHIDNWYYIGSPQCQCNGHSKCENNSIVIKKHLPLSSNLPTLSTISQGKCGECSNQTIGDHCERCAPGFYGDARNGGTCQQCECNGQADKCNHRTGSCYCTTKGVTGDRCDRCEPKYYGDPKNNKPCYYDLAVDFIFTFKLDNEESKDKYVTQINFFSVPYKKDTDVQFTIVCDGLSGAEVSLNLTSTENDGEIKTKQLMLKNKCDNKGIRRTYSASEPGFAFGTDTNTTFLVKVDNFKTPIKIQISFAQSPPINWVLFFVIFAACFIVLLVVAGLLWMIKLRFQDWRENQRRYDEIEQMSSRPFASVKLEINGTQNTTTPISIEPSANYKTGIFSCVVRLPTGSTNYTPHGTSGIAVASSICFLTPAQLALLQTPETGESKNNCKVSIKRFLPFINRN